MWSDGGSGTRSQELTRVRPTAPDPTRRSIQWQSRPTARWRWTGSGGSTSIGCAASGSPASRSMLAKSELGSVLCFDMNNVRYITATHIGTWAQDKISRFTLLPQNDEPILWDFGSAARHHQLNCDWLGERSRAGIPLMRGAMTPEMGRSEDVARKIKIELETRGLHKEPVGVDVVEPPMLFALQKEGLNIVDGQQLMSDAREIKTRGRDLAAHAFGGDGGRRLLRPLSRDEARHARERRRGARRAERSTRWARSTSRASTRSRPSAQPAPARVLGSHDAPGRPGVLRHPPLLHGVSHLLLPLLRDRLGVAPAGGCLQALPRLSRRVDRVDPSGPFDGGSRVGVAEGHGVRLPGRGSGVRAADGTRHRPGHLGEADDQPARLARASARDQAGHGVRARDVLADQGRHERRAHRRRDRRDRRPVTR